MGICETDFLLLFTIIADLHTWNLFQGVSFPLRSDTGSFPTNRIGGASLWMEVCTGDGDGTRGGVGVGYLGVAVFEFFVVILRILMLHYVGKCDIFIIIVILG